MGFWVCFVLGLSRPGVINSQVKRHASYLLESGPSGHLYCLRLHCSPTTRYSFSCMSAWRTKSEVWAFGGISGRDGQITVDVGPNEYANGEIQQNNANASLSGRVDRCLIAGERMVRASFLVESASHRTTSSRDQTRVISARNIRAIVTRSLDCCFSFLVLFRVNVLGDSQY